MLFRSKAIIKEDKCYLVEGYTDVLSVHETGIENVVASSGTALTQEQVRLIKRFTQNITILYDGDAAGIKASLRGIDLVLEESMNVRIVLLPDGEDPDSFSKKKSVEEFRNYLATHETDFIRFKTEMLLKDTGGDPVKRAEAIRDIVRSIAVIPETITRTVFIKECSTLLEMSEAVLYNEVNKLLRQKGFQDRNRYPVPDDLPDAKTLVPPKQVAPVIDSFYSEEAIIRLLLKHGADVFEKRAEEPDGLEVAVSVADFIVHEITSDELIFVNSEFSEIFSEYKFHVEQGLFPGDQYFVRHSNPAISSISVNLIVDPYVLSRIWYEKQAYMEPADKVLKEDISETVIGFKFIKIKKMKAELIDAMGKANAKKDMDEVSRIIKQILPLIKVLKEISVKLGDRII